MRMDFPKTQQPFFFFLSESRWPVGRVGSTRCFFNTLRILVIDGCDCLEFLVEGMGSFIDLRTLMIVDCPHLSSLPKHLTTLENLIIMECESLEFDLEDRNGNGEIREDDNIRGCGFGSLQIFIYLMGYQSWRFCLGGYLLPTLYFT